VKALVLEDFHRMVVAERPRPEPAAGEVLLRIVATGICGSDIHGYTGENGRRVPGQIMGHESVARIEQLGPGTEGSGLVVGQPATFNPLIVPADDTRYAGREQHNPARKVIGVAPEIVAAFAQFIVAPAVNVHALPESLPISYGALIEPLAVALHAVRRARVRPEDRVLVLGGGPIGQSVVLAAQKEGAAAIVVSEPDAERRALCERLGAYAIDPAEGPVADRAVELLGGPADVALDAVGVSATLADALAATALGGTVCLVGMGAKRVDLDAFAISTAERNIVGSFTYSADDFADTVAWVSGSPEGIAELISEEVPLAEGPDAFARLSVGVPVPGKVLVHLDESDTGKA
jgi:threonine dehydrogenase-like Zn-dependent dehydrogenase